MVDQYNRPKKKDQIQYNDNIKIHYLVDFHISSLKKYDNKK